MNRLMAARLRGIREIYDDRTAFDFDDLAQYIEDDDIESVSELIEDRVDGVARLIRDSMDRFGITQQALAEELKLDRAVVCKALKPTPEKALPFETIHLLCTDVYRCSPSDFLLNTEWPCKLPRKYELLLRCARELSAEECEAVTELLQAELPPPPALPLTNRDMRDNIARRVREICVERGACPRDLINGAEFRKVLSNVLRGLESGETFIGRFRSLMVFSFAARISINYLLMPDYSPCVETFAEEDGHQTPLRDCERNLLSVFLSCPDTAEVNRAIGQFGAFEI